LLRGPLTGYFDRVEGSLEHGAIRLHATDPEINDLLREETGAGIPYTRHFSQSEDFFLKLSEPFEVPSFSIHHDVRRSEPSSQYRDTLRGFFTRIRRMLPGVFSDLRYTFDPADILRPSFYRLFRVGESVYLFSLRMDLVFRPHLHTVVQRGSNDVTPVYRTDQLILDMNVVPLREVRGTDGEPRVLFVDQMISETWIGETGRGYFVQGIWIDSDLTKFFSKLALPAGKRIYPYYPFNSKFRSLCLSPPDPEATVRRSLIPVLHQTKKFLRPHLEAIQQVLRKEEFSENLPLFQEIKATVPEELEKPWAPVGMKVYLNERDMKEFEVISDGDR
jgi:hypothetical protein